MKVLHLPSSVSGNSWGLSQAEREIGIDSKVLVSMNNYLNYPADIKLNINYDNYLNKIKSFYVLVKEFLKIRNEYDIFHFNYGSSLIDFKRKGLMLLDLPYYSKQSKIFVTYNGCDARQKYKTMERTQIAACHNSLCYNGVCNSGELDKIREKKIEKFSKYAKHIFALNPDLMWFLPKEKSSFLPCTIPNFHKIIEYPIDISKKRINIVHAPTNRIVKGSNIIIKALENVKKKYSDKFDLILVENMPYLEALEIYKKADLVIDQLLIGWYGGFAVETMKMKKPVMVYINEDDLIFIPNDMKEDLKKSIINVNINNIEKVLEEIIINREILLQYSENGNAYVNKWHDPLKIAAYLNENFYNK